MLLRLCFGHCGIEQDSGTDTHKRGHAMKSDIIIQLHKNFEDYAHQIDGEDFWFAHDLQGLLGYATWENYR